jgi:hypothetical protein
MRRSSWLFVAVFSVVCMTSSFAFAQEGFTNGTSDIGGVISVGGLAGAGTGFGGRFEMGVKDLPNLGNGVLGIGVAVDRYSWDDTYLTTSFGGSYTPISVTANYHFHLENRKVDPFVGLGLGDLIVHSTCNISGFDCGGASASSGIYFVGHAGIRYYFSDKLAAFADVGSGYGNLHVGIVYKLK